MKDKYSQSIHWVDQLCLLLQHGNPTWNSWDTKKGGQTLKGGKTLVDGMLILFYSMSRPSLSFTASNSDFKQLKCGLLWKLQVFTNTVMLKLNFIIRLNGTIANTIRLCHNTGVEKISCYLLRWRWLHQCTLNSLFAPVVTRREICCQCSFAGAISVLGHSGLLMGWIANRQKLSDIFMQT